MNATAHLTRVFGGLSAAPRRLLTASTPELARTRDDREFLPAALEIMETPASPAGVLFLWLICAMMAATVGWSFLAHLDIFSVAPGRIQVTGRSKVVQSLEPGRVKTILVHNGEEVVAGQTVIELESTELAADVKEQAEAVEALDAETVEREAAVVAARADSATTAALAFPQSVPQAIRDRASDQLGADLSHLMNVRASLKAQLVENLSLRQRLRSSIEARTRLIATLQERIDMRQALIARGVGMRASVLDALQALQSEDTNRVSDEGQSAQAQAAAVVLDRKLDQASSEFIDTQIEKLVEAKRKRDWAREDLIKAVTKAARAHLAAPLAGIVQQLAVTTIGQVVGSGEPLLVVVPSDGTLEVETLVGNGDIGFIKLGQTATIKVDAFPFTRYGTLEGKVTRISGEAVEAREAAMGGDATSAARGQGIGRVQATQATRDLAFPVTLALTKTVMDVGDARVKLSPGMTVSVEIRTGDRKVIDYLLSPLRALSGSAAHER